LSRRKSLEGIGLPARSAGWLNEKKLSRILLLAGAILLVALVVGLLGYLFVQDVLSFGKFPGGVKIVGVSVAGLTQEEAITKLRTELTPVANKPLTLKVDDEKFQISPTELGLMLDYKKMVEEGYDKAWSVNIFERMARRFVNRPKLYTCRSSRAATRRGCRLPRHDRQLHQPLPGGRLRRRELREACDRQGEGRPQHPDGPAQKDTTQR